MAVAHSLKGTMLFLSHVLEGTGLLFPRVMMSDCTSLHSDDAIVSPSAFLMAVIVLCPGCVLVTV